MKKIFFSIVAIAALAACSKSEVAYEQPDEIGFVAVANNITKAPISGTTYPTDLHLYVNAFTSDWGDVDTEVDPNYFSNIEFEHRSNNKWGGVDPQYWPNETALHFSGYSKSGNVSPTTASYNPYLDQLSITDYTPGVADNDLMWFPKTTSYTRNTGKDGVTANMYHTCSWITFMIQGDATTGVSTSSYEITSLTITGIDLVADVTCTGAATIANTNLSAYVDWNGNEDQESTYVVTIDEGALAGTYTKTTVEEEGTVKEVETNIPINIETGETTSVGGNIVVIPQKPGSIDIEWTYKSTTSDDIEDSATGLSLKLNDENTIEWEPGKHYVYTITITANEILISPSPVEWVDGTSGNVTVE